VAVILNNLATTYLEQGNLKEAGKLMTAQFQFGSKQLDRSSVFGFRLHESRGDLFRAPQI